MENLYNTKGTKNTKKKNKIIFLVSFVFFVVNHSLLDAGFIPESQIQGWLEENGWNEEGGE